MAKVERLRKQLNISNDLRDEHADELAPSDNSLQQPKNDTGKLIKLSAAEKLKTSTNTTNLLTTLKGEEGYRRTPKNGTSEATRHDKMFKSQVNNLRGDLGVIMDGKIKSSESRDRKPVRDKLNEAGEF